MFLAALEKLEAALRGFANTPSVVVFRRRHVPAIDATAPHALEVALETMKHDGVLALPSGVQHQPMRVPYHNDAAEKPGLYNFCANIDGALEVAGRHLADTGGRSGGVITRHSPPRHLFLVSALGMMSE